MIEREEIWKYRLEQADVLIFGDGLIGGVIQKISQEYINNEGIKVKRIVFYPSPEVEQAFNIQQEEKDTDGSVRKEYPANKVKLASHDPMFGRRTFVFCDYNGNQTALEEEFKGMLIRNTQLQKECALWKTHCAHLYKENQLLTYKERERWSGNVELWESVGKSAGAKYYLGKGKDLKGLPEEEEE